MPVLDATLPVRAGQTGLRRAGREPNPIATGRLTPLRLFSTLPHCCARRTLAEFCEMPDEDHLGRIRRATPSAIRRTTSPISTAANCRWLELLPETKTPFWLCGIAYDSKYPQFGHRNVVTGMTLSLFSTARPVQKLGWGSPGHQFSRCNPACVLSGTQPDSMCA
jgi:hypothetical protein